MELGPLRVTAGRDESDSEWLLTPAAANDLGRGYSARRVTAAILRDSGRGVPLGGELLAVIHVSNLTQ